MINIEYFKQKLEEEKARLEADLAEVATRKLSGGTWEAVPGDKDQEVEMRDEVADRFEDLTERQSTEEALEGRLESIDQALAKITNDTYGICEVGGEQIEEDRLEANPASTTCKAHME